MPAAGIGGQIVPIVVVVVVVGLTLWWLFHTRYRLTVTPGGLTLVVPTPGSFTVKFETASTIFSSWTGANGTITVTIPASGTLIAGVSPGTATVTSAAPTATFAVAPTAPGSTAVSISATDGSGTANASLPVGVTAP